MSVLLVLAMLAQARPQDERERWLPPVKTVTLSGERTALEAIDEVRRQTGLEIEAEGLGGDARYVLDWQDRPVLEALDDLCRMRRKGQVAVGDKLIVNGLLPRPMAVSHWKQFRTEITSIAVRAVSNDRTTTRTLLLTLALTAQPGTKPAYGGFVRLDQATDDKNKKLKTESSLPPRHLRFPEGEDPAAVMFPHRHVGDALPWEPLEAGIALPEGSTRLAKLSGVMLVTFPHRQVGETIAAAAFPARKEIKIGPRTLVITNFKQTGDTASFHFTHDDPESSDLCMPPVELLNATGEVVTSGTRHDGSSWDYDFTYKLASDAPVASVRISGYVGRTTIAVPFEFRELVLPRTK